MKARRLLITMILPLTLNAALAAQTISGTLDSRLSLGAGAGDAPAFLWGLEELANVRLQARLRDKAVFYAALNLAAASGSSAIAAERAAGFAGSTGQYGSFLPTAFSAGENYSAALELERLYVRVPREKAGLDLGLMRIPLGYSLAWGSADFLNPRDPFSTNARPRGVLGTVFSLYPGDNMKFSAWSAAPKSPLEEDGSGIVFGIAGEGHFPGASVQGIYSYETPGTGPWGIHRAGFSLKADAGIGLVAEAMFTWNPDNSFTVDGLSAGAGFDYNLFGGKLYLLAEYLFNGETSTTGELLGLRAHHLLQVLLRYNIDDYTNLGLSCTASFEDMSFLPVLGFGIDLFQGLRLSFDARFPLDRYLFSGNEAERGALGPVPPALDVLPQGLRRGTYFSFSSTLTLKF